MPHRSTIVLIVLLIASSTATAAPLAILPKDVVYDPAIPTPRSYLGFEIGERHIQHHQLVGYLRQLASVSDRVTVAEYARSHGRRPLIMLTITAVKNHQEIESIRKRHLRLADPARSAKVAIKPLPAVINMGYSVHGNEPSGGNVAPLVAYYLAAATGEQHQALLDNVVVLMDPCLNPDGFERFAHWANNHRGAVPNPDPNHREHREPWPSGRTNYYWFDLNRDWLPAQHPESQGRLAMYHRWKPNVVLDFHEMGTDATYFFQPGVPARNNPLTPSRTFKLTRQFARHHAAALDGIGSLYYTEERFDDFYMGKGSTYPDLHGAVGILFEQASSRGHLQESVNGPVSFPFTIRNQFLTSMSSLQATLELRESLLDHKRTFYQDALALARASRVKAHVVAAPHDLARLHRFLEILARHQIQAYRLAQRLRIEDQTFEANETFVIPTEQPEFRFLEDLFARRTEFNENVFYDVSAWTLALAFQLQSAELTDIPAKTMLGQAFSGHRFPRQIGSFNKTDLAYAIDWRGYYAPKTLHQLLADDVNVRVASEPFDFVTGPEQVQHFEHGTLLVPLGIQPDKRAKIVRILRDAGRDGVAVHATTTGLTPNGIDLGSSSFQRVPKPKLLLVTGGSSYEAGEVWHLLDQRLSIPITLVADRQLSRVDLTDYSAVILVSGSYDAMSSAGVAKLSRFVETGGSIIATGTSIEWLDKNKIVETVFRGKVAESTADEASTPPLRRPYAAANVDVALRLVRGSIFETRVDHTHPVGYGYAPQAALPVFRNNRVFLEPSQNAYATPVVYEAHPLLAGYVSAENLGTIAGSASVVVVQRGQGRAILIAENPNLRAFWYGTNRLFLNSLFFGPLVRNP
ncbi:MAG TPA: M14 family metallopeptidase [Pirellulaceae bacterium]|nr:M14 family metallopeptidase [Pirellulaceae bacterium]